MTNQEILDKIRALQRGIISYDNKDEITKILFDHKCYYLLTKNNHFQNHHLIADAAINQIAIKERYRACANIFAQIDFPYAVIKGAVLSQTVYKNPFIRRSVDIDILVRRQDVDFLKTLLIKEGFINGKVTNSGISQITRQEEIFYATNSHQMAPFIKETSNCLCPYINIDVNFDIVWGESKSKIDMNYVLSYVEEMSLLGLSVFKLTPEMEFVAMCLHHYKDSNSIFLLSSGSLRLGLYCDIYDYLNNVNVDFYKIKEICETLNVGKFVYVCLFQTQELFNDEKLQILLDLMKSYEDILLCNSYGLDELGRKVWNMPVLDRVFHPNIYQHIQRSLSDKEKEKIKYNYKYL